MAAMNRNRYSIASLGSPTVDSSFISVASTLSTASSGSYEIESEVGRDAVMEMCYSALSRRLEFPDDQLEVLRGRDQDIPGTDGGHNVAKNIAASFRLMKRALSHKQAPSTKYLALNTENAMLSFGSPLTERSQPALFQLISQLENYISSAGIFRKPGNKHRMDLLVTDLETKRANLVFDNNAYRVNDYACVLKKYLSELPEPLLLKRHLDAYLQTADLSSESSKVTCIQLLMLLLPPINRSTLQHLMDLLCQVSREPSNLMDAHNLGLIFAPTLFLASKHEALSPASYDKLSNFFELMVDRADEIFEVPTEVQVVAERYIKKRRSRTTDSTDSLDTVEGNCEDEEAIELYSTSSVRQSSATFHQNGADKASAEVAALFELVSNMPDGPQKTHFLKRFESASKMQGTPAYSKYKKASKSTTKKSKKNKENATPRVPLPKPVGSDTNPKPALIKGSLIQDFDRVDNTRACKSAENVLATPLVPPATKYPRTIATMSPMVTDV